MDCNFSKPWEIRVGDCIAGMREMPDASVDSIVTDPPYELGFMGKSWDASGIAFNTEVWKEALRVLKPGGHLLAFSGSRTYHRMVVAIEDAGFEIRDQMMWVYGSGFPKSLNIGKQIDKRGGASIGWFGPWLREERKRRSMAQKDLSQHFPSKSGGLTGCVANWELGLNLPTVEQFNKLCVVMALPFASISEAKREVVGHHTGDMGGLGGERLGSVGGAITSHATAAAKQWRGWGTALKPAHEPIVIARKPLIGTVSANVLEYSTGALNIDGCRVVRDPWKENAYGRWPANLIHDGSDEVLAAFPDAPGQLMERTGEEAAQKTKNTYGDFAEASPFYPRGDTGSAARFFYCAKASRTDRNDGCGTLPDHEGGRNSNTSGQHITRRDGWKPEAVKNNHPTVKPTELMRYLCRLVTPPVGLVLDPFTGSGSTGRGAVLEGFRFLGLELSPEYVQIAEARITSAQSAALNPSKAKASRKKQQVLASNALPLETLSVSSLFLN